jgi:hypothetical protein
MAKAPESLEDVKRRIEQSLSEKPESDVKVSPAPSKSDTGDMSSAIDVR